MSRRVVATTSVAVFAAVFWAIFAARHEPARQEPAASAPPAPVEISEPDRTPAATPTLASAAPRWTTPSASPRPAALDEAGLMSKLRELHGSDPALTLQLARDGNQRFKDDADAAERSWFVVKSLSDLGRHDEARVEARRLVQNYRGSSWAEDVYRHLLLNPGTHPAERGYGKALELE